MTEKQTRPGGFLSSAVKADGRVNISALAKALGENKSRITSCFIGARSGLGKTGTMYFRHDADIEPHLSGQGTVKIYLDSSSKHERNEIISTGKRRFKRTPHLIAPLEHKSIMNPEGIVEASASGPDHYFVVYSVDNEDDSPRIMPIYVSSETSGPLNLSAIELGLEEKRSADDLENMFVRIMNRLVSLMESEKKAFLWYESTSIPALGYLTAKQLVKQGDGELVMDYLDAAVMGAYA